MIYTTFYRHNFVWVFLDLDWFNCTKPLLFNKDLKGKLVLLDFFTYCCVNCLHILPVLHSLQQRFTCEDGLVIVSTILLIKRKNHEYCKIPIK